MPAEFADRLETETAADAGGVPSWPVLGHVLRDEALLQAYRRLFFLRKSLGVPAGDEYGAFRTFVGKHLYADIVLEPLGDAPDFGKIRAAVVELVNRDSWPSRNYYWKPSEDLGPRHWPLASLVRSVGLEDVSEKYSDEILAHADRTRDDLVQAIEGLRARQKDIHTGYELLDSLAFVSPDDPYRSVRALERGGTLPPEQLAAIEKEFESRPTLLQFLAAEYREADRFEDAVRVAARAAELVPSIRTHYMLALMRRDAGDEKGYVDGLKEALRYPSYGLTDSDIRIRLAAHRMRRGDYGGAEPYATEAAESYSARSLVCAVDCYTGLRQWERAEALARNAGERYGTLLPLWYLWCRRTGHGDEAAAKTISDAIYAGYEGPAGQTASGKIGLAYYRMIEGRDRDAAKLRESLARDEKNPAGAVIASVLLMRAGEREKAASLLGEAKEWTTSNPKAPDAARRAGVFHDAIVSGKPLPAETVREFADAVETFAERERISFRTYFGEMMVRLGNREDGLKLLKAAAEAVPEYVEDENEYFALHQRTIAALWLREHVGASKGDDARPADGPDQPDA